MALNKDTGGIRPKLDEQSANSHPVHSTVAALHELVGALRDNVFLEPWAIDELLDMQPSNEHAKALLVALSIHELLPADDAGDAMRGRGLASV